MWSFVFSLAVLMWMWAAASTHLVRWLSHKTGSANMPSRQRAYVLVVIAAGAVGLLCLPYWVLPGSVLSMGWTQEMLEKSRFSAVLLVVIVAMLGFMRALNLFPLAVPSTKAASSVLLPGRKPKSTAAVLEKANAKRSKGSEKPDK
jgi:hypothetical protein